MSKPEKLRCADCGALTLTGSLRRVPRSNNHCDNVCISCIDAAAARAKAAKRAKDAKDAEEFTGDKYKRGYRGQVFDVYDIIEMWSVTCPALQHAIKKILVPGKRGKNDTLADLKEARDALTRAIELQEMREARGHDN